jgi:CheY-like chemotaxis protein
MKRILIVEDNPADLYLIRQALTAAGLADCVCDVAETGAEALNLIHQPGPCIDLVLLDLTLPKGGSLEVARAIKSNTASGDTLVVAWSSSVSSDEAEVLSRLGIQSRTKPGRLREYEELGKELAEMLDAHAC